MEAKKQIKLTLIMLFFFLAGIIFYLSTEFVEPMVSDFFVSRLVEKKEHGSKDIVLVVIDDQSLEKIRWPWTRDLYSEIFDFLENKADAKLVLFDAFLSSPDPKFSAEDKIFFDYLKTSKKTVMGFDLCREKESCAPLQKNLNSELNKKFNNMIIKNQKTFTPNKNQYTAVMFMPPDFLRSVQTLGLVMVIDRLPEQIRSDKTIRTYSNIAYFDGKYYPSMALSAYSKLMNEKQFTVTNNYLKADNSPLKIKFPYAARKAQASYTYLKWYKPYNEYYSHEYYSAIDIIQSNEAIKKGQTPKIDPKIFKDKIVFVGGNANAQSLDDKLGSPVLLKHAGVDIQATALNNYLDNTFTAKADMLLNLIITLAFLFVAFILICNLPPFVSLVLDLTLVFIYFIIYITALDNDYILNFITLFFLVILLFAFTYIFKFMNEGEKKDKIQRAMGKYLSKDVMQKVVRDIDNISLGGKKVNATIMFIDIRKFTTISENMAADDVTVLLNEYFTTVYPIITKYNGVLNKFIGDAVLAIFEDETNHAKDAIFCADEVLQQIKNLQQKWLRVGKPKIDVGVGINSGEVFLGNIGTQERMEYTVIGDTVNTASRIEGYNKIYKTKFLIGEQTYDLVKNIVDVIKINQVTIRGKSQKVNIYEVLRIRK